MRREIAASSLNGAKPTLECMNAAEKQAKFLSLDISKENINRMIEGEDLEPGKGGLELPSATAINRILKILDHGAFSGLRPERQ
ncbi:MAG: hypothetical protein LBU32_31840 [Clostridiales bacterium]|nr:hypothetical protein [Clostridiales bacterium]